jgi:MFS transporter, FHS family, L-fucose permease
MFLAYFTFGLTGVLGALTPDIIAEYQISRFAAGLMGSAMFLALAIFAIPSGLLADRAGARRVILWGVSLMAAGCLLASRSHSYPVILAMVFAIGVGTTMLQTSGSPLIQRLDKPANYPRNLTYTIGICTVGGFLSIFVLAYIRGTGRPWQSYYLFFGVVCIALLGFLFPSKFPSRDPGAERMRLDQIGKLLRNPILITYGLGIYLYTAGEVGTYFWIPKFFEDVHGIPAAASNANAATLLERVFPSMPALIYALFMGMQGVGRLTGGAILKRFGSRRVMRVYSVLALASLLAATFGSRNVTAVGFAACGLFCSVLYPLLFSGTINSFAGAHGTISGLLCTGYIAAAVMSPVQGWIADHAGMRVAMLIPALCFCYVIGLAMFGRAKYE